MSVRIVQDVPAGSLARQRMARLFLALLGVILVAAGLLVTVYPVMLAVIFVDTTVRGETMEATGNDLALAAGLAVGAWLIVWIGVLLIRGRRSLGIYLRKFGFADTTRTVSHALRSAVGRSVRLVTLDDSQVAPVGVGAGKRIAGVVRLVAAALVVWLLFYLFGGASKSDTEQIIKDTMEQTSEAAGGGVADQIGAAMVGGMIGGMIAGLLMIAALVILIIFGLIGVFAYRAHRSARLAQQHAIQALSQRHQVEAVARRLAAVARRVFSPRLIVVTVPGSFWQEAVRGFAGVSKVAVIDVSHPTDPLLWEVSTLKPLFAGRLVFVGSLDHVATLARPQHEIAGTPHGMLAQLLDGEEIIAYGSTVSDRRRFTKALRRRIANLKAA